MKQRQTYVSSVWRSGNSAYRSFYRLKISKSCLPHRLKIRTNPQPIRRPHCPAPNIHNLSYNIQRQPFNICAFNLLLTKNKWTHKTILCIHLYYNYSEIPNSSLFPQYTSLLLRHLYSSIIKLTCTLTHQPGADLVPALNKSSSSTLLVNYEYIIIPLARNSTSSQCPS